MSAADPFPHDLDALARFARRTADAAGADPTDPRELAARWLARAAAALDWSAVRHLLADPAAERAPGRIRELAHGYRMSAKGGGAFAGLFGGGPKAEVNRVVDELEALADRTEAQQHRLPRQIDARLAEWSAAGTPVAALLDLARRVPSADVLFAPPDDLRATDADWHDTPEQNAAVHVARLLVRRSKADAAASPVVVEWVKDWLKPFGVTATVAQLMDEPPATEPPEPAEPVTPDPPGFAELLAAADALPPSARALADRTRGLRQALDGGYLRETAVELYVEFWAADEPTRATATEFQTALRGFLESKYQLRPFAPAALHEHPDGWVAAVGGGRVNTGAVRKLHRPGLADAHGHLCIPALAEVD